MSAASAAPPIMRPHKERFEEARQAVVERLDEPPDVRLPALIVVDRDVQLAVVAKTRRTACSKPSHIEPV